MIVINETLLRADQQLIQSRLNKFIYLVIYIQIFTYFVLIFLMLKKYKQILTENYSIPVLGNYRWLMQFAILLLTVSFISLIKNIILLFNLAYLDLALEIVLIFILIFISWLLIKSLQNPGLFTGVYSHVQLVRDMVRNIERSEFSSQKQLMESEEDKKFAEDLNNYMLSQKPYLNASLSIADLADQLKIPLRELSIFINHKLNKHFFDFVNEYRIEKAMEILENPGNNDMTILEILYEVGFNSKSSFNTTFKIYTGLTPTEYRKKSWRSAA